MANNNNRPTLREALLEDFDTLLHNYIAEHEAEQTWEDVKLDQRLMHDSEIEVHLSILRK